MNETKSKGRIFSGIIVLICALLVCATAVYGLTKFIGYKQSAGGGITVTGSASVDFDSDLIVWGGSFSRTATTTQTAYAQLQDDANVIKKYLLNNGVTDSEIVFSSMNICPNYTAEYFDNGNYKGSVFTNYTLSQNVTVQSANVDNVDKISRDITELIDSGVDFISQAPEYYYTKLDDLKLQMIADATDNAKQRAQLVAENSGCALDQVISANLGVFQITAQNSATDEYSAGGVLNTSSRAKTAQVTVKLFYSVK